MCAPRSQSSVILGKHRIIVCHTGLYCLLALPLEASFGPRSNGARRRTVDRKGSVTGEEGRIQSPLEGLAAAALTIGLPPLVYAVAHRHVLLESMQHVWSLLLLGSAPLLFLTCLQVRASCPLSWKTFGNSKMPALEGLFKYLHIQGNEGVGVSRNKLCTLLTCMRV